jgi:hypothetical protein
MWVIQEELSSIKFVIMENFMFIFPADYNGISSVVLKQWYYTLVTHAYILLIYLVQGKKKGKAIPDTDREGLWGVEAPTFSTQSAHSGAEVVSLMCQLPFTPQEDFWYSFLLEAESTPGP